MTAASLERRQAAREQLEQAIEALASSDGWQQWLRTRSLFRTYSFGNQCLIAMQSPDASRVAGYKTWQKLGRQVRKSERGITIHAPMTYKEKDKDGNETGETRLNFRAVRVFDVAQTDGDDLPEPPREPITGDSHADYLPRLEAFAGSLGYEVSYQATGSSALGYCDEANRRIVVSEQAPNAMVRTLIHECAHALGIGYAEHGRAAAEVIVESAAYIACGSIGLDTSGEAVSYVAGWADGDADKLREVAAKVDEIAGQLEAACGIEGGAR
jgi:antirestriction protein ArdC